MSNSANDERRLRDAFEQCSTRVLAYALRHTDASSAHDVVADVFLVAWRRIERLPDDPLPWLLVIARNTINNGRRSTTRRQRLTDSLITIERAAAGAPGADETAVERDTMLTASAELSAVEREALLLIAWDGLSVPDAAAVAGCSRHAFELRLHRARVRLRRLMPDEPDHPPRAAARPLIVEEISL